MKAHQLLLFFRVSVDVIQATHVSDELHLLHRVSGFLSKEKSIWSSYEPMSLRVVVPKRISI